MYKWKVVYCRQILAAVYHLTHLKGFHPCLLSTYQIWLALLTLATMMDKSSNEQFTILNLTIHGTILYSTHQTLITLLALMLRVTSK